MVDFWPLVVAYLMVAAATYYGFCVRQRTNMNERTRRVVGVVGALLPVTVVAGGRHWQGDSVLLAVWGAFVVAGAVYWVLKATEDAELEAAEQEDVDGGGRNY